MITKYKTYGLSSTIVAMKFLRETDQFVYVASKHLPSGERREAKQTSYNNLHDTWDEAHAYLLERATNALEAARRRLAQAQGEHGNIKGMKKPAEVSE